MSSKDKKTMTKMTNAFTPSDLTEEGRDQLRGLRKRKMDLLEEIEMIRNELKEVDTELESMYYLDDTGKSRLKILSNARRKFNKDPNNGIQYLVDRGLLEDTHKSIAEWLFQGDGLSKTAIGDFLGNHDDRSLSILKLYTGCFDFAGLFLVDAIRIYLKAFRLPGEAQKIDRIMDSFATQYVTANPNTFPSADACHSIAFSSIMLNTLMYNPNVKDKTTLDGYIDMCKEYLDKNLVTVDCLSQIYDSLKNAQFAMPVEERGSAAIHLNAEREGYLYKQSSGQFVAGPLAWKRRWFVLSEQCLYYFEQTTDSEPRGIIPLQNVGIRRVEASSRPHMFEIFSLSDDRIKACKTEQDGRLVEGRHSVYRFCAVNQDDLRLISQKGKTMLSIRDARWMAGVQECTFQEKVDEIPEIEEFDPFYGLESNIICPSCKFGADAELERDAIVAHYKTQWHRVNVSRVSKGKQPLSEEEFENAVEDEEDSVDSSDEEESTGFNFQSGSLALFVQNGAVYSLYRSILHEGEKQPGMEVFMRSLDCAVFLLAGGHFAGAIFKNERMTLHKTIQRYVIRAKQGKAQSASDSKGVASSAGSSLRRYNERTLRQEISEIITDWKETIGQVPLVFIRCASYQKSVFYVDGVLEKGDPRIRNIPFATKRPSLAELKSAWDRLHQINEHGSMGNFAEIVETLKKKQLVKRNLQKKKKEERVGVQSGDEEEKKTAEEKKKDHLKQVRTEELKEDRWPDVPRPLRAKIHDCIAENAVSSLKDAVESSPNLDQTLKFLNERRFAPFDFSFLHNAAVAGQTDILAFLLNIGCDPSVQDDEGRVPYALSADKSTKAVFIGYRAANPNAWSWGRTHIPVVQELTEEQKTKQEEKKREKKQKQREKMKEKKAEAKAEAEEVKAKDAFMHLTEREKRAMAAEARMGTLSRCVNCGNPLPGTPFEYNDVKLCSPGCVAAHRSRFHGQAKAL